MDGANVDKDMKMVVCWDKQVLVYVFLLHQTGNAGMLRRTVAASAAVAAKTWSGKFNLFKEDYVADENFMQIYQLY